ncbi:ABC transporter permease [Vibrio sinensis]|uniref:ABC transporter permease n=1 Tax=Vibrio sinensis TaxID=2302434 RepID=A0A3A6R768_9VIBR|nr:ABC transporter permease [Vibrio sinensis]RJX72882.1 ABC transporter permease [Vibrio sinensis]
MSELIRVNNTIKANTSVNQMVNFLLKHTTIIVFILMLIVAGLISDKFYTQVNILNVLKQSVPLGIVSLGLLFVIITGGIDLSVGSVMALVSIVTSLLIPEWGLSGALFIGSITGIAIGFVSGGLVSHLGIPAFVATLALMTIARGLSLIFSNGQPIFVDDTLFQAFGTNSFLAIPYPVLAMFVIYGLGYFVLHRTIFGRLVVAVGSNETATKFAGISVKKVKFAVYVISGFTAALAGLISATRTGVGSPILGIGFELDAIAAVVIGGASLSGGRGTVINCLFGVMILGVISNILNLINVSGYNQQVIKGIIIIFAVMLESLKQKKGL